MYLDFKINTSELYIKVLKNKIGPKIEIIE